MKLRAVLPLLGLALVITGCAGLPTGGAPEAFSIETPDSDPPYQTATGPRAGSGPDQLVSDFLRACQAGASDDYLVARQYLTPSAAQVWLPEAGSVLVYDADEVPRAEVLHDGEVKLSLSTRGSLSTEGIFTEAGGTAAELLFSVEKSDGEWRISELEDGVVLSRPSFMAAYQAAQLYFLAPTGESLVPDPRWYPRKRLPSYLVAGLIAGPSDELADAVYNSLSSLSLPTQGAEVSSEQVIRVSLVGDMYGGESALEHLAWQVSATLSQVANATGIEIELNGTLLPHVEPPYGPRLRLDRAVGIKDGWVVIGDGDRTWGPIDAEQDEPSHPAVGPDAETFVSWIEKGRIRTFYGGVIEDFPVKSPIPPVVDRWGWTWTAEGKSDQLLALGRGGRRLTLPVDVAESVSISALSIAPDGIRVALISEGTGALTMHMIVRDPSGAPVSVGPGVTIPVDGKVVDAAWSVSTTLALLVDKDGSSSVLMQPLEGFSWSSSAVPGAVTITAGSGSSRIYLQDSDGALSVQAGVLWRPISSDVLQVKFPG